MRHSRNNRSNSISILSFIAAVMGASNIVYAFWSDGLLVCPSFMGRGVFGVIRFSSRCQDRGGSRRRRRCLGRPPPRALTGDCNTHKHLTRSCRDSGVGQNFTPRVNAGKIPSQNSVRHCDVNRFFSTAGRRQKLKSPQQDSFAINISGEQQHKPNQDGGDGPGEGHRLRVLRRGRRGGPRQHLAEPRRKGALK